MQLRPTAASPGSRVLPGQLLLSGPGCHAATAGRGTPCGREESVLGAAVAWCVQHTRVHAVAS